jgi:dipeptidyl-peptidase 4
METSESFKVYRRAEQFFPWNVYRKIYNNRVNPNWIGNSSHFWYLKRADTGKEFMQVDVEARTCQPVFDSIRLSRALSEASGQNIDPQNLPFDKITLAEGKVGFDLGGKSWHCDLKNYQCEEVKNLSLARHGEIVSPDGNWTAFVRDFNLFVRSIETGKELALTSDGALDYSYATSPDTNLFNISHKLQGHVPDPVATWSPDSKKLFTHRVDQRGVKQVHLVQSVPQDGGARHTLHSLRVGYPGDEVITTTTFHIFDVEKHTRTDIQYPPQFTYHFSNLELNLLWWGVESDYVYFIGIERGFCTQRLCEANANSGVVRIIIEESGETQIESTPDTGDIPNVRVLNERSEAIWFSERDGWGHLYLYDAQNGVLKNQITHGNWMVREIMYLNDARRMVWFMGGGKEPGRDPYYRHLYSINLDGSALHLLTPENAEHEITFSPDGKYFVDNFSRADSAPQSVLRSADGELILALGEADFSPLLKEGWQPPEPFSAKARDGVTDIYGLIFRPSHFDSVQSYPVIDAIYPGPQVIRTPKAFPGLNYSMMRYWPLQSMAELGFIVVTIDGLGTPYRSKAYHDLSYRNLEDAGGLEDHITAIKQLAKRYSYMDMERVGIFGHSGGGYATVRALLCHPDFYKVGVSSAGVHDLRGYLAGWGEKYQGLLEGDSYVPAFNTLMADRLQGKLLLMHGEMDDNVNISQTYMLVDALIKANKDFDLMILPNVNHNMLSTYYNRKLWDYFYTHLLGKTPPKEYPFQVPGPEFFKMIMD